MTTTCPREDDVRAAVTGHRWESADAELREHAANCECCGDVLVVARLFADDREHARRHVHLPAAGQVWWRAAVRTRLDAAHAAARPLTWLHGIAGACAVGLAWAGSGMLWPSIRAMVAWAGEWALGAADSRVSDVAVLASSALQKSLPLALVVALCVVVTPVALYFVLSDDNGR